ncbi:MAG: isoprenylcysteine carboxylmethyltransferase family protein [Anaerolineae bacterium]|jgi:protein-S-isoprenylcysteine O-methyltransferase Ste14
MQTRHLIRAIIGFALYLFLVPALLFISAGTLNWPMAWLYVALLFASTLGSRLIVLKRNPDTLRERARFTSSQGTKTWDRVLVMIVGLFGPMATMVVAGLDHRWGWSVIVPQTAQLLAALVVAAGYGLAVWAMVENRYFSAVARIQKDRGQEVVTTGPYRVVRHPSYAGAILASLALPLMLDALWSLIPALLLVVAVVVRTALEDQMLMADLEGYQRYALRTRCRLGPGLW